ncbi:FkbM family methyltransferase [Desulfocurvibacter africanus]|uniref:Methyltransferase FkbM family n=1 Tax=Desulfocurvibacter africanus subsp. africanus str. Walvis Bay TaxID=690850 RepID=F3YZF5_DESAF|nr:FkbM family methyltransferase [Desulfocurvibacter africanus]EGJ51984.1 methyltransferase FkbM family [Desulfocurvibacter africanus subsp. africanus str. Walvis Bay]
MHQPTHVTTFAAALAEKLLSSIRNRHTDNHQRFYQSADQSAQLEDLRSLESEPELSPKDLMVRHQESIKREVATKSLLHSLLADQTSRDLLVSLAAYGILGHRRVKLPYYRPDNVGRREALLRQAERTADADPDLVAAIRAKWTTDVFSQFEFDCGYGTTRAYTIGEELFRRCFAPSYEWQGAECFIRAKTGDIVLDCGAAFGDVSLQFAQSVGASGHVVCFEPYPLFLRVFRENMRLNPLLAARTTLVERAVWNKSGETLSFIAGGGGSRIDQSNCAPLKIITTTIDETVATEGIPRVDFIKMDIEGAELKALHGAEATLRRFRPRLAVCLYHNPEDFHTIPDYLQSLGLGYRFHLNHHYINEWETVLYATPA